MSEPATNTNTDTNGSQVCTVWDEMLEQINLRLAEAELIETFREAGLAAAANDLLVAGRLAFQQIDGQWIALLDIPAFLRLLGDYEFLLKFHSLCKVQPKEKVEPVLRAIDSLAIFDEDKIQ